MAVGADARVRAGGEVAADPAGLLEAVSAAAAPLVGTGRLSGIPALAAVDPHRFGFALATVDGAVHGVGDWREPFSIQSISKLFALAVAVADRGAGVWERVGRRPSGDPFNSAAHLEFDRGIPSNPCINAGALVVCDLLLETRGDAFAAVRDLVRAESGDRGLEHDARVAASEAGANHRNAALAHLLAGYGNLTHGVEEVLDHYVRQCALRMSCADLARAAAFLARHGVRRDGTRLLSRSDAKRINSVMLLCGVYDGAGEFAYRVGLPSKSGVGGGILAVVPGRGAVCAWSPGLDERGNSAAAVAALDAFTTLTGWSVF